MEINKIFNNIYKNKKVLITGHTGFKGSWLVLWLNMLGAEVFGYSLAPETEPNHYNLLRLDINEKISDIRDRENLNSYIEQVNPDIIFHLAAQPIVRRSYNDPVYNFETNIIGTVNVLESFRNNANIKALINITSDKCYENIETEYGYKEDDKLGGYDPYSASKACSEIITSSYRNSFFNVNSYGINHNKLTASVRAGNVIGGGDWAEDRLIPDIMRAISKKEKVIIRNPESTRPWQHVLDPLSGYLAIGEKLLEGNKKFSGAWNFGPESENMIKVGEVVEKIKNNWNRFDYKIEKIKDEKHEAVLLRLDCTKAENMLEWESTWDSENTFKKTVEWYKRFYEDRKVISIDQIRDFSKDYCRKYNLEVKDESF